MAALAREAPLSPSPWRGPPALPSPFSVLARPAHVFRAQVLLLLVLHLHLLVEEKKLRALESSLFRIQNQMRRQLQEKVPPPQQHSVRIHRDS